MLRDTWPLKKVDIPVDESSFVGFQAIMRRSCSHKASAYRADDVFAREYIFLSRELECSKVSLIFYCVVSPMIKRNEARLMFLGGKIRRRWHVARPPSSCVMVFTTTYVGLKSPNSNSECHNQLQSFWVEVTHNDSIATSATSFILRLMPDLPLTLMPSLFISFEYNNVAGKPLPTIKCTISQPRISHDCSKAF